RLKGHLRPLDRIGKPTNLAHDQPRSDRRSADNGRTCCTIASARCLENGRFSRNAMLAVGPTEVCMRDVLDAIEGWRAEGHRVALATVPKVKGAAPRPPGAKMAVSDDGRWVGSVSGGCVEGAVLEEAGRVLAGEPAHLVTFGITHEMVWDVGLACGRGALVTVVAGPGLGAKLLVTPDAVEGSLGDPALDETATRIARELLPGEEAAVREVDGRELF